MEESHGIQNNSTEVRVPSFWGTLWTRFAANKVADVCLWLSATLPSLTSTPPPPLSLFLQLQSMGHLLEEQLPEMMTELLATVRDKMLCPAESELTRSLLMEVIELHAHSWSPLEALTTQYYNRTIQKLTTSA